MKNFKGAYTSALLFLCVFFILEILSKPSVSRKQVSAGMIVYYKLNGEPKYLLLHYIAGHWDLAKGKLKAGETNMQAALRELQEETGISKIEIKPDFATSIKYIFEDYAGRLIEKTVHFFVGEVKKKDGVILSPREHKGFTWLPFNEAVQKLTYQTARDVLIKADEFIKNIHNF
jgi:8-oxo-dGTP pyrophosphatase MutT (NUDIX family)